MTLRLLSQPVLVISVLSCVQSFLVLGLSIRTSVVRTPLCLGSSPTTTPARWGVVVMTEPNGMHIRRPWVSSSSSSSSSRHVSPLFLEYDDDDVDETNDDEGTEPHEVDLVVEGEKSSKGGIISTVKGWFQAPDDGLTTRQRLTKLGTSVILSYGWVSNMSYSISISLAWFLFTKKTGLSPLAPDQWKRFLALYAGFFVFNNFIRPVRIGLAVAASRYFDRVVNSIQDRLKINKAGAIACVVFLANVVGTLSAMSLGITLASMASGVPIFPPPAARVVGK